MSLNTAVLSRDNPELLALEEAYSKLNLFEQSMWRTWADQIDITKFRGEGAYLSQMMGMTEERYWNTYQYVREHAGDVIELLDEDDAFGCVTFHREVTDRIVSRDLLDSACELRFLEETLGVNFYDPDILDIGSGYGRFAYRRSQSSAGGYTLCIDAVPLSTFLCNFYLKYRGCEKLTRVIPLHQYTDLQTWPIDIATNQYSFSEMPLSAIKFWLSLCADLNIPHFFLVPHAGDLVHPTFLTFEPDGSCKNYLHLFAEFGYKLERERYKFPEEMSDRLIYNTKYMLFRRG